MRELPGLPTEVGVYVVIMADGQVKTRVIYNHPRMGLYVAQNINETGTAQLKYHDGNGWRWFGPVEMPKEPAALLNEHFTQPTAVNRLS
jgi:hypothetical protein